MKKSVLNYKIQPPKCDVCTAAAEVMVSFRDRDRPGPISYEGKTDPLITRRACLLHVQEVNDMVLREAGLLKVAAKDVQEEAQS